MHAGFKRENLREGDHFKDRGLDGRIILKWVLGKWHGGINWIDLTQGTDIWRVVVNALMNIRVP